MNNPWQEDREYFRGEITRLEAKVEHLRSVLRHVEWKGNWVGGNNDCPWCNGLKKSGHRVGCEIAIALEEK